MCGGEKRKCYASGAHVVIVTIFGIQTCFNTNILNLCACHTHNNSHQGWKIVRNAHTHRHLRHIRDIIIVATTVKILYTSNLLHANPGRRSTNMDCVRKIKCIACVCVCTHNAFSRVFYFVIFLYISSFSFMILIYSNSKVRKQKKTKLVVY